MCEKIRVFREPWLFRHLSGSFFMWKIFFKKSLFSWKRFPRYVCSFWKNVLFYVFFCDFAHAICRKSGCIYCVGHPKTCQNYCIHTKKCLELIWRKKNGALSFNSCSKSSQTGRKQGPKNAVFSCVPVVFKCHLRLQRAVNSALTCSLWLKFDRYPI